MDKKIKAYLKKIASKGGKKSRRKLSTKQARKMVQIRTAKSKAKKDRTEQD